MSKWTHLIYLIIIAGLTYLLWQQSAAITAPAQQTANGVILSTDVNSSDVNRTGRQPTEPTTEPVIAERTAEHSAAAEIDQVDGEIASHREAAEKPLQTDRSALHFTDAEMAELLKKAINVEKVKELLHTEAVDQDWAYAMQDNLQLLYDKNEVLHRATLNHIECYTTVCEVQFTNTDAPIDFMSSFHHKMVQEQWYEGNYQSVMTTDSETQTQTFYIVKTP